MNKVVIFGASGFLGTHFIERLYGLGHVNILAVARNEAALVTLKEKFPRISVMVGDIADPWVVQSAMVDCMECYIFAAMKHVGLAEQNVRSCVHSNVNGLMNIIGCSLEVKPKLVMFVSSDKAAKVTGIYGATKRIGEGLMAEAQLINRFTDYRVIRYGNVAWSSGSILTKWKPKMQKGEEVILTDPEATRFFWTVQDALDMIFECKYKAIGAAPYIPHMKSVSMGTVLEACMDVWGKSPVKIIGLQTGENKHETMDGITFSDQVEKFTKEEFKAKFLQ